MHDVIPIAHNPFLELLLLFLCRLLLFSEHVSSPECRFGDGEHYLDPGRDLPLDRADLGVFISHS